MIKLDAPAVGFRAFNWSGGPLRSIGVSADWPVQREPQIAKCEGGLWSGSEREQHPEGSPVEACGCGLYAYSKPELVQGTIKAVVIGYGRLIVHPDGWRAEKAEIIGLIAPPAITRENLEAEAKAIAERFTTPIQPTIQPTTIVQSGESIQFNWSVINGAPSIIPSLDALEILAEQYGARVIRDWDDGIALAQEQGATPIPDEVYAQAAENAPAVGEGGYFLPPGWVITTWSETIKASTENMISLESAVTKVANSMMNPPKPKTPIEETMQLKREKRELHAKLWKPDKKAA